MRVTVIYGTAFAEEFLNPAVRPLTRAYNRGAMVKILERLVREVAGARSPADVYEVTLDALEGALGISRASILIFDDDRVMRFKAWRGLSDNYRSRVEGHTPWSPESSDASPIFVENVTEDAKLADYLPVFQAEGIAALAFIPLVARNGVLGKFMLYYAEPHRFTRDETAAASIIAQYVAFAIDRQRAELKARASEERLRFALNAAAMGTWEWNPQSGLLEWSDGLKTIHGFAADDNNVSFERYKKEIHPEDRDRVLKVLSESAKGQDHHIEYRIILPDGSVKWVEGKGRLFVEEGTGNARMAGVCMDVHTRKQGEIERGELLAQVEMARARADFRAKVSSVLASSLDYDQTLPRVVRLMVPFFADWCTMDLVDKEGVLKRIAVAHRDPDGEATLLALRDRYSGIPGSLPTEQIMKLQEVGFSPEISMEALRQASFDSAYFETVQALHPESAIAVPLRSSGKILGVLTFVLGGSGRRYAELDVELAQDLAQRSATAIDQARLFREVQDANRMKDEFLATLSHELRTPLNAILGWSSMLSERGIDDPLVAKGVAAIDRNARAQTKLISDLLDVSRIVTGKLLMNTMPVDILKTIDAAVDAVRLSCVSKQIALELLTGAELPKVLGDPDRLQQIIWNLLSNAVKFTPAGGRIVVKAKTDGSFVEVTITDSGAGIAPDFLPHVFDRFRQADASSTRAHSGLGLGLAIVRHLTELHGGTVRAESPGLGSGSTFVVRFPAAPSTTSDTKAESAAAASDAILAGVLALVVDDDRDAREFVQICLERSGARVRVVSSAKEAELQLGGDVDVLITDIAMPEEDGFALLKRARATRPRLPAIAFTAYAMPDDRERLLRAGFDRHLVKPVEARGLVKTVSDLLRTTRAH
jgi:PAS domain S-box-containing protein